MAEPGGSDAKGFDWQNRRLGTQRENRRELAIPEPRVGGLCEPGGLLAGSAGKRQADRQQNMAGSTYRRREAVVAVAVGDDVGVGVSVGVGVCVGVGVNVEVGGTVGVGVTVGGARVGVAVGRS